MVGYLGICDELNTFDVELGTDAETVQCKSDCFAVIFLSFLFSLFQVGRPQAPDFCPNFHYTAAAATATTNHTHNYSAI